MVVMKFGGSSVESAQAIRRVAAIVRASNAHPVVVVSAMGKTTDRLQAIAQFTAVGNRAAAARGMNRSQYICWLVRQDLHFYSHPMPAPVQLPEVPPRIRRKKKPSPS